MGLLRRPVSLGRTFAACRAAKAQSVRRPCPHRQVPLPLLPVEEPAPSYIPGAAPTNDFPSFFAAELGDAVYASAGGTPVLVTDRRAVMEAPGRCVLHPSNEAVWLPLLTSLQERGALTSSDRVGAQRFLPAATFQDILPSLWEGDGETLANPPPDSPSAEARSPCAEARLGVLRGKSTCGRARVTLREALAELRRASPNCWVQHITDAFGPTPAAGDNLARIQAWQEVFYSLSVNPSFAMSADLLRSAHDSLLQVVDLYYADCVSAQHTMPPPRCSPSPSSSSTDSSMGSAAARSSIFAFTRMPPALLRQWKKLYRTHFALLDYSELFHRVVLGEEAVAAAAERRIALLRRDSEAGHISPDTYPRHVTTAVLEDDDLLLFYLSIPGRRECGLPWEAQWERTLQHAHFALARLFRTRLHRRASTSGAAVAVEGEEGGRRDGMAVISKAAGMLMNVAVWVRNNNAEGTRCLEATRTILETYLNTGATSGDGAATALATPDAAQTWAVVKAAREAAFTAMLSKAERLQYACSPGLFDVATAATALEILKPEDDSVITARDVHILLHASKVAASVGTVWSAAVGHPSSSSASQYGLITVGLRLVRGLVQASARHGVPQATLRRVGNELCAWCAVVGRPLHLASEEMESLWHSQVVGKDGKGNEAAYSRVLRASAPGAVASASPSPLSSAATTWTCGCGFTSSRCCGEDGVPQRPAPSCAACVLRSCTPHSWQCPKCLYTANTGEPSALCLHCGAAHPALPQGTDVGPERANRDDGSELPAATASSLFVCEDCHTCTAVRAFPGGGGEAVVECGACRSSHGYVRSMFSWQCGCGETNSPTHSHCRACTRRRAEVVANEEEAQDKKLPESAPAIAETAPEGFSPVYRCVFCQHDVEMAVAGNSGAAEKGPGLYAECPHCRYPHPRHLASVEQGRRVRCPTCDALVPAEAESCPVCHNGSLSLLRPLLVAQADQPWLCHHCGHSNSLCAGSDSKPQDGACDVCGTQRVSAALWERGRRWDCVSCGASANFGVTCGHCHARAPGIPAHEVHVWRCTVCLSTLNGSWQESCSLPGCGGHQRDAIEAHKQRRAGGEDAEAEAEEEWVVPYAPWACESCGRANLSDHFPQCRGCGAEAEVQQTLHNALPTTDDAVLRSAEERGETDDEAEGDLVPGLSRQQHRPLINFTSAFMATAAAGQPRLTAVERLLADAADTADAAPAHPSPPPPPTMVVVGSSVGKVEKEGDRSGEVWEDAYARAVFSV